MGVRPGSHIRNPQRARVSTQVSSWLNFNPLSLRPDLWLDAADVFTITESGGDVSQWNDKSGNGYNFVQATGASQPKTGTRTQNGFNVIDFDGSNDFMTGGDILDLLSGGFTMFVVSKLDAAANLKGIAGKARFGNVSGRYTFIYNPNSFQTIFEDTANRVISNAPSPLTNSYAWTIRLIRNFEMRLWRDGRSVGTATPVGTTSYDIADIWMIGAYQSNVGSTPPTSNSYFDGFIGEIIFFLRDLTDFEVAQVNDYLRQKWRIY